MRRIILASLAVVAAATVFQIPTAEAQVSSSRNPWCLRDGGAFGSGSWDCSYHNFQQCEMSSRGVGGICVQNPNYRGGGQADRRQQGGGWNDGGTWGRGGGGRW